MKETVRSTALHSAIALSVSPRGKQDEAHPTLTEPGTNRRLVRCPRAAARLDDHRIRVYLPASDARNALHSSSNRQCKVCGFSCLE